MENWLTSFHLLLLSHTLLILNSSVPGQSRSVVGTCSSTVACDDPGQICSGGKCRCIVDMGLEVLNFWACDNVMDCEGPIRLASDQLSYAGHHFASQTMNLEAPSCTASTICPNPNGRFGYCDIFWPDGDAL